MNRIEDRTHFLLILYILYIHVNFFSAFSSAHAFLCDSATLRTGTFCVASTAQHPALNASTKSR